MLQMFLINRYGSLFDNFESYCIAPLWRAESVICSLPPLPDLPVLPLFTFNDFGRIRFRGLQCLVKHCAYYEHSS